MKATRSRLQVLLCKVMVSLGPVTLWGVTVELAPAISGMQQMLQHLEDIARKCYVAGAGVMVTTPSVTGPLSAECVWCARALKSGM